eukprot:PITA_24316
MPSEEQSKDEMLVRPLQPTETGTKNPSEDKASKQEEPLEEEELIDIPALVAQVGEPSSFQEAVQHHAWVDAMVEEYSFIMVNNVWEVVPSPQDKSVVGLRWIYKVKYVAGGSVEKYKARFVAKGYAQKEGIDYEETFAPVAKYTSIRTVISLAKQMGWEIHPMF